MNVFIGATNIYMYFFSDLAVFVAATYLYATASIVVSTMEWLSADFGIFRYGWGKRKCSAGLLGTILQRH